MKEPVIVGKSLSEIAPLLVAGMRVKGELTERYSPSMRLLKWMHRRILTAAGAGYHVLNNSPKKRKKGNYKR